MVVSGHLSDRSGLNLDRRARAEQGGARGQTLQVGITLLLAIMTHVLPIMMNVIMDTAVFVSQRRGKARKPYACLFGKQESVRSPDCASHLLSLHNRFSIRFSSLPMSSVHTY